MFSHIMLGADDIDASKTFYDATLGALGFAPGQIDPDGRVFYMTPTGIFALSKPINGGPASGANGGTVGFAASSPEVVEAWHATGVAHGGTTCENPPGLRETPMGGLYLAYMRDPSGNKLCTLYQVPG
jgi:catechol 2,3-dioxygenase-like lactoylglutathione lyase family enzyme